MVGTLRVLMADNAEAALDSARAPLVVKTEQGYP